MRYLICLAILGLACFAYAQADMGERMHQHAATMPSGRMGQVSQMSPELKLKCQMMMQAQLKPDDPAAMLALKDQLNLSDDQAKRLQAIQEQARKDAFGVLNEQQKQQVAKIPATPDTGMDMHQHMMHMMRGMHGQDGGQMPMNCPMMNMGSGATTQPGGSAPADHAGHAQ